MVRHVGRGRRGESARPGPVPDLGTPAVVIAKVALVTLIIALGVAAAVRGGKGRWAAVGGLPLALGIAAGLIGGITNTAVLLP